MASARNMPCPCGSGLKYKKCCLMQKRSLESIMARNVTPCLLCQSPPHIQAMFKPSPEFAKELGQPEDKQRIVLYCLCEKCFQLPEIERNRQIEAAIVKQYQEKPTEPVEL